MDTVGKNTKAIAECIKHQLDEGKLWEQMRMLEKSNYCPFTGDLNNKQGIILIVYGKFDIRPCETLSVNIGLP